MLDVEMIVLVGTLSYDYKCFFFFFKQTSIASAKFDQETHFHSHPLMLNLL